MYGRDAPNLLTASLRWEECAIRPDGPVSIRDVGKHEELILVLGRFEDGDIIRHCHVRLAIVIESKCCGRSAAPEIEVALFRAALSPHLKNDPGTHRIVPQLRDLAYFRESRLAVSRLAVSRLAVAMIQLLIE